MINLEPATGMLAELIDGVRDEQLREPTPCAEMTLGDLLDHVDGLSLAFAAAADKAPLDGTDAEPSANASRLGDDWRSRIRERLATLAAAWQRETAWTGMTQAGGVDLPGEVAGVVALNEVVVHGWDIAVASGQRFDCEPHVLEAAYDFVRSSVDENPDGTPGLFGPPVPLPHDAPLVDRLVGLSGRDPAWRAKVHHV